MHVRIWYMIKRLAAVLMAVFLVTAIATPANAAPTCQTVVEIGELCLTVDGGRAIVSGPLGIGLSVDVPQTTIEVPVPVPTQIVIPGPTQTVTAPGQAPVTVTRAPSTVTQTRTATVTAPPTTATSTVTRTPGPTVTARPTATTAPSSTNSDSSARQGQSQPDTIVQRVVKKVGIPLLWVILGIALAIIAQYLMYVMGRSDAKHADDKFLENILNRKKN